ncbi:MAG: hypothetical protein U0797_20610 [Gemmataceae bacterium]
MSENWKNRIPGAVALAVLAIVLVVLFRSPPALAQKEAAAGFPRYSVMDTEGHNLIVTDNQTNTVYFYTIDKDKEIGTELKLRGTIDLTQVGKPVIKPSTIKADR